MKALQALPLAAAATLAVLSLCTSPRLDAQGARSSRSAVSIGSPIETLDSALDDLVSAEARLKSIRLEANGFFEGPTWLGGREGFLIFSDIPGNRVMKMDSDGHLSVFLDNVQSEPAANALRDTLYTLRDLVGSNGTIASGQDKVVLAMFGGDGLLEVNWKTGERRTLASGAGEPRFHRPNDLAWGPNGDLYFSAEGGLFRLHAGQVSLFRRMPANGLAFSHDRSVLYATDGPTVILKIVLKYDGTAGDVRTFVDTKGDPRKGEFLDGVKVDLAGNLWAVAPGGLWIMNSDGKLLGRVLAPTVRSPTGMHHRFTNLAFGGRDGKTLFLTGPGGVYSLPLKRAAMAIGP